MPEEQHADQNEDGGNDIPDKVRPMDALTATKPGVFVIAIKAIPALFHLTTQPRQKSLPDIDLIPQECMELLDLLRVAGRVVRDSATKIID